LAVYHGDFRYISAAIPIAISSSALTSVPTPKIRRKRKSVIERVIKIPRRELSKIKARNRNRARNRKRKKKILAQSVSGFVPTMVSATNVHKTKSRKSAG
jgi:hypothetical protein